MKLLLSVFFYVIIKVSGDDDSGWSIVGNPLVAAYPCNSSTDIHLMYEPGRSPKEENIYNLWIDKKFPKHSIIKLKFDKGATVTLTNETFARIDLDKSTNHAFRIRFFESHEGIGFLVQGCALGIIPYIQSVNINTKEYCQEPLLGVLDSYIEGYKIQAQTSCTQQQGQQNEEHRKKKTQQQQENEAVDEEKTQQQQKYECGRRQTLSNVLSENGESQRGDWPWHTAVFKSENNKLIYICGGTLINNFHVLTAAHCVSRRGVALKQEMLTMALGKNILFQDTETGAEWKEVGKITIHENFLHLTLVNDIALVKLKNEVTFTKFIQPACLWYKNADKKLPSGPIMGTIIGWGINENENVSIKLNQVQFPMVPDDICIQNKPDYFLQVLNGLRFCAGNLEVAVACNGDSGGGFHVFIPDDIGDNSTTGVWHVRGIISMSVPHRNGYLCSTDHYTVFTDVDKYREWISNNIM